MSAIHAEQSSTPQINGHLHQRPSSGGGGGGGGGGGFTAVNGFANKPPQSSSNTDEATSPRRESYPRQHSIPDINAMSSSRTDSNRSSPTMISVQRRRLSSSESAHSPTVWKRPHTEAFSDPDDSLTPKRERGSEDRKANSSEGDSSYAKASHNQEGGEKLALETLRRDSDPTRRGSALSNGDDRSYAEYEVTRAGIILEHDRKKRKRVFSNRTKTGCMTCRKRKKKCDEAHPECKLCHISRVSKIYFLTYPFLLPTLPCV